MRIDTVINSSQYVQWKVLVFRTSHKLVNRFQRNVVQLFWNVLRVRLFSFVKKLSVIY